MKIFYTVYMERRPVTDWVTSLDLYQPEGEIYQQFGLTFAGWPAIEHYQEGAVWDIFSSVDSADPRQVLEVRAGVVPSDREQGVILRQGQVPEISVTGYDHVWLAQRRQPEETIVMVPGGGYGDARETVADALARYDEPVGRYRVWTYVSSVHLAVERLAAAAGVRAECYFPDADLHAFVVPPSRSYWEEVLELIKPWRVELYYHPDLNTVVFVDPEAPRYLMGEPIALGTQNLVELEGAPLLRKRWRRIILRSRR